MTEMNCLRRHPITQTTVGPLVLRVAVCLVLVGCTTDSTTPEPPRECPDETQPATVGAPGLPAVGAPASNPQSEQGIALGRRLFHDTALSRDDSQSCASCHRPELAFSDGRRFSIGVDGIAGTRSAPALTNTTWSESHFWDGRAGTLEDQAIAPVENPIEMGESWDHVVAKLQSDPQYPDLFCEVFGTSRISRSLVVKAIAQFERTFVSNNSRYDRWLRGQVQLTPEEQRGLVLFKDEPGDCFHCHTPDLFTDLRFHNTGLDASPADPGLAATTGQNTDVGKFKTPTLRNVALTAPYMHDGRFQTLDEVLDHYISGGVHSPNLDPLMRVGVGLPITAAQKQDLIAFLHTLTDTSFVNNPEFRAPANMP